MSLSKCEPIPYPPALHSSFLPRRATPPAEMLLTYALLPPKMALTTSLRPHPAQGRLLCSRPYLTLLPPLPHPLPALAESPSRPWCTNGPP